VVTYVVGGASRAVPYHDLWGVPQGGVTALWWSCQEGLFDVAQILLAAGTTIGYRNYEVRRANSCLGATCFLLRCCYLSTIFTRCLACLQGNTELIVASNNGHHEVVELLLAAGADLEATNTVRCINNLRLPVGIRAPS
jgi:hypothetical protein